MAKKINVKTSWYNVSADVVISDGEEMDIVKFDGEGSATNSKRALAKTIRESYENDGYEVIAIRNIQTCKVVSVTTWNIAATNDEIVEACRAYGLPVEVVLDMPTDSEGEGESNTEE